MVTGRWSVRVSCFEVGRRTRTRKGAVEDICSNTLKKVEKIKSGERGDERDG